MKTFCNDLSVRALAALLLAALLAAPSFADDDDDDDDGGLRAQAEVEDLVVCYALGTDALGRAVNAIGGQPLDSTVNIGDPDFDEAVDFYRKCFADNFSFTLEFDGVPLLTVPDPSNPLPHAPAWLQWGNFVNNAFRGPGFRNTQHHMGSIVSRVHGRRAHVQSYLIATHAFGPNSGETGVRVIGGTYTDEVVRKRGRWLIEKRTLNITSNVDVPTGL